ncbi:MAG: hypothetical protein ACREOA_10405 [Candidatus Dormibacteria bacterium]
MGDQPLTTLPVDDPRRLPIRRAVFGTLWAVAFFVPLTATKAVPSVYHHAPWLNDPYDVVISFTMFFVPLAAACLAVQVLLCVRSEALSVRRVGAILRASRVIVFAAAIEIVTDWVALGLGANRAAWTGAQTGLEVSLLALATATTAIACLFLVRAPRLPGGMSRPQQGEVTDWLGDAVILARRESRRLGSYAHLAIRLVEWSEEAVLPRMRRHPVWTAAGASAAFSLTVLGWQAYREDYLTSVALIAICLGFCGMFAFTMGAGSYFGLIASTRPSCGIERRGIDASVVGCGAAILALAFRKFLWPIVGSDSSSAGPSQFALLVGGAVLLSFAATLLLETVTRSHRQPAS